MKEHLSPAPDPSHDPPPGRGTFPRFIIILTVVVTLAIVALIYWRWVRSRFPTSYLLLVAERGEWVEGAEVVVLKSGEAAERQVARVTLAKTDWRNDPGVPILVEGGAYTVTTRYGGRVVNRRGVVVPHRRLVPVPITTQPSVRDDPMDLFRSTAPPPP